MNTLDLILGGFLLFGLLRGLWKGFVLELTALVSVLLGVYGAIHFSFYVGDFLQAHFSWDRGTIQIVAFVLTLLGIMLAIGMMGKIITRLLETVALGFANRLFGGIFGVIKWAVICGTVLMYLNRGFVQSIPEQTIAQSVLYQPVRSVSALVFSGLFDREDQKKIENFWEHPSL